MPRQVAGVDALPDPCPLPGAVKKRQLNERERLLYAPMADVGGLLYDKDAVYIDIPDWKVWHFGKPVYCRYSDDALTDGRCGVGAAICAQVQRRWALQACLIARF